MGQKIGVTDAQLMEIGEAVRGGMAPILAMKHFGFSKGVIYRALRHYHKETGVKLVGPSVMEKSRMKKAAQRRAGTAVRKANGNAITLATANDHWQARAMEAEQRADALHDRLELATDEVHTLQKIIITLGRAL
jgi:hypothetical protein